jgi:hypothetical protein
VEAFLLHDFDVDRKINWHSLSEFVLPQNISKSRARQFKSGLNVGLSAQVKLMPTSLLSSQVPRACSASGVEFKWRWWHWGSRNPSAYEA